MPTLTTTGSYDGTVPRLWTDTIDAHRRAVRDATLDTAAALVAEHGLAAVTMSQLAERTGIGRATLYKYFPDVSAVLTAWHERQLQAHLTELQEATAAIPDPAARLTTALQTYATLQQSAHRHLAEQGAHSSDLAALLHSSGHVAEARTQLHEFLTNLIADAARSGHARTDMSPTELATYCLHALTAAATAPSKAATHRLVTLTLTALTPEHPRA